MVKAGYDLDPMENRAVESKAELKGTYLRVLYSYLDLVLLSTVHLALPSRGYGSTGEYASPIGGLYGNPYNALLGAIEEEPLQESSVVWEVSFSRKGPPKKENRKGQRHTSKSSAQPELLLPIDRRSYAGRRMHTRLSSNMILYSWSTTRLL